MANDQRTASDAAMAWLGTVMSSTDQAVEKLRRAGDTAEGTKGVMVESAVVGANSNRELAAAMMSAAQVVEGTLQRATKLMTAEADTLRANLDVLNTRIETFTATADKGTNRLVVATYILAAAALIAAGVQAYVMYSAPPQIIVVSKP